MNCRNIAGNSCLDRRKAKAWWSNRTVTSTQVLSSKDSNTAKALISSQKPDRRSKESGNKVRWRPDGGYWSTTLTSRVSSARTNPTGPAVGTSPMGIHLQADTSRPSPVAMQSKKNKLKTKRQGKQLKSSGYLMAIWNSLAWSIIPLKLKILKPISESYINMINKSNDIK